MARTYQTAVILFFPFPSSAGLEGMWSEAIDMASAILQ